MAKEFKDKALVANAIKAVVAKHFKLMETRTVDELVFGGYVAPIFESLRTLLPLMKAMKIHKDLPEKMAILWDVSLMPLVHSLTVETFVEKHD